jgi:hypothetical protein
MLKLQIIFHFNYVTFMLKITAHIYMYMHILKKYNTYICNLTYNLKFRFFNIL